MQTSVEPANSTGLSIVIVGAMNPAIHHPVWYRELDAISEPEFEAAIKSDQLMCTPEVSHFLVDDFEVSCDSERWTITSASAQNAEMVLRVAKLTFEKLKHTPVVAFGFNVFGHRPTKKDSVANYLSELIAALPLRFSPSGQKTSLSQSQGDQHQQRTVRVESSARSSQSVFVFINYHHVVDRRNPEVAVLLEQSFLRDVKAGLAEIESIVSAING